MMQIQFLISIMIYLIFYSHLNSEIDLIDENVFSLTTLNVLQALILDMKIL